MHLATVFVAHLILFFRYDKMHARLCHSCHFFYHQHRYNSIVLPFFLPSPFSFNLVLLVHSFARSDFLLLCSSDTRCCCSAANNDARYLIMFIGVVCVQRFGLGARKQPLFFIIKPCGSNLKTQSTTSNNSFKKIKYQIVRAAQQTSNRMCAF